MCEWYGRSDRAWERGRGRPAPHWGLSHLAVVPSSSPILLRLHPKLCPFLQILLLEWGGLMTTIWVRRLVPELWIKCPQKDHPDSIQSQIWSPLVCCVLGSSCWVQTTQMQSYVRTGNQAPSRSGGSGASSPLPPTAPLVLLIGWFCCRLPALPTFGNLQTLFLTLYTSAVHICSQLPFNSELNHLRWSLECFLNLHNHSLFPF